MVKPTLIFFFFHAFRNNLFVFLIFRTSLTWCGNARTGEMEWPPHLGSIEEACWTLGSKGLIACWTVVVWAQTIRQITKSAWSRPKSLRTCQLSVIGCPIRWGSRIEEEGQKSKLVRKRCGNEEEPESWPHPPTLQSLPHSLFIFILSLLSSSPQPSSLYSQFHLSLFPPLPSPPPPSLSFSMAQNHSLSLLVAAMDGLWFHQVILFSNSMSLLCPTTLRIAPQTTSSDSLLYCSSDLSAPPPSEEETSAHSSASPLPQVIKSHFCLQT